MFQKKSIVMNAFVLASAIALISSALEMIPNNTACADTGQITGEIQAAEPHEKGRKALELAGMGRAAVPGILTVLAERPEPDDMHFFVNCIIALSLMGAEARDATDTLMALLDSPSEQIRYVSAHALGRLWEGQGRQEPGDIREINSALLSRAIAEEGAAKFAPALALTRINSIEVSGSPNQSPQSLEPDALTEQVYARLADDQDKLIDLDDQAWPLLIKRYLGAPRSETGERALNLLLERRPLKAVDFILERLADTGTPQDMIEILGDLFSRITGIDIDTEEARQPADRRNAVQRWRRLWHETLKERKDEDHRAYAWSALEQAVRAAQFDAYPADFVRLEALKTVIISQYDSTEQIPPHASEMSKKLLKEHLEFKQMFMNAKTAFANLDNDHLTRLRAIQTILDVVQDEKGRAIGLLYLNRFIEFAEEEENPHLLSDLSEALTAIGEIPILLGEDRTGRSEMLRNWKEGVVDLQN